ncbi:3-hydroxyacyl-CoA dehydrogenase NAD-binding domain-containing protein [Motilimonas pumila]|uniref:enoyl-CoA hydratase n=1 Tax=Motilimonas pumila TaxID=2303987 RepID=A0A418YGF0_9GAMM|nr:3-hydroxyacyl-CoA dehydrogenase NAD-binding domain-containing protein [Motilimonas pumila]RJG48680.1 fatty acid oxidation complex subunit alpha FadJ [Motilimonas pumila]
MSDKAMAAQLLQTPTLRLHYRIDSSGLTAEDEYYQAHSQTKIARLVISSPQQRHNTFDQQSIEDMALILDALESDNTLKGLIITSNKSGCFIAGADINMLDDCRQYQQAFELARQGQHLFERLSKLRFPVVAAIDGVCLGGGYELALACTARVTSDSSHTKIGLPEVQLGLLPGSGGTQRLPRLIGCAQALQVIMTGKQYRPAQALRLGMVDKVVPAEALLKAAMTMVNQKLTRSAPSFIQNNALARSFIFRQANAQGMKQSQGHYPAVPAIIAACRSAYLRRSKAVPSPGEIIEAEHFAQLVMSPESQALRRLFLAQTAIKQGGKPAASKVDQVLVLGAGLMGAGIALVSANQGRWDVNINDLSEAAIAQAMAYSYRYFEQKQRRGYISQGELNQSMARFSGALSLTHLGKVDVVFEAIYEDLAAKQQALKQVEHLLVKGAVFASNTSSIPIAEIAKGSQYPAQVIGLHYFSPVEKMPLVEVIPHQGTSKATLQQTLTLAHQQGKTAIVVKDSAGFYVNRILAPYINEAMKLLMSGESVQKVDQALTQFGFPVGPFKLLDEVGLDIAAHIAPILQQHLGSRFTPANGFDILLEQGRLGKKVQRGFYMYQGRNKDRHTDARVMAELKVKYANLVSESDIVWRCVILMLLEVLRCLDEAVVESDQAADIGAVFGIGFPPYWGGPIQMARTLGAKQIEQKCRDLSQRFGERFTLEERLQDVLHSVIEA